MEYFRLRGTGVSPGIALGEISLKERVIFTSRKELISKNQIPGEMERLKEAVVRTGEQLLLLKEEIRDKIGDEHAFIFDAHLMILEDKSLSLSLNKNIQDEGCRAEWAISQVHEKYVKLFDSIEDEYFRQRQSDVTDVLSKVYLNLKATEKVEKDDHKEKILVAHDLLPSEADTILSQGNVLAVALEMGGPTSHTAILARSLNIPAVMGVRNITKKVRIGDSLIVDGTDGEVIVNPPLAIRKEFSSKKDKYEDYRRELKKTAKLEARTLDGVPFYPFANIELPEEVAMAFQHFLLKRTIFEFTQK